MRELGRNTLGEVADSVDHVGRAIAPCLGINPLRVHHQESGVAQAWTAAREKTLFVAPGDEEERRRWREEVERLDPCQLVFVDERVTHTTMVRPYA